MCFDNSLLHAKKEAKMLEENLDLEGVDEICCLIEDLTDLDANLLESNITLSISAPLK